MIQLRVDIPARDRTPETVPHEPLTGDNLYAIRNELIDKALTERIDVTDHFHDQVYAVRPWPLRAAGEKPPMIRTVDDGLILELAAAVYKTSPAHISIIEQGQNRAAAAPDPETGDVTTDESASPGPVEPEKTPDPVAAQSGELGLVGAVRSVRKLFRRS